LNHYGICLIVPGRSDWSENRSRFCSRGIEACIQCAGRGVKPGNRQFLSVAASADRPVAGDDHSGCVNRDGKTGVGLVIEIHAGNTVGTEPGDERTRGAIFGDRNVKVTRIEGCPGNENISRAVNCNCIGLNETAGDRRGDRTPAETRVERAVGVVSRQLDRAVAGGVSDDNNLVIRGLDGQCRTFIVPARADVGSDNSGWCSQRIERGIQCPGSTQHRAIFQSLEHLPLAEQRRDRVGQAGFACLCPSRIVR
jgi:hypothetical protein